MGKVPFGFLLWHIKETTRQTRDVWLCQKRGVVIIICENHILRTYIHEKCMQCSWRNSPEIVLGIDKNIKKLRLIYLKNIEFHMYLALYCAFEKNQKFTRKAYNIKPKIYALKSCRGFRPAPKKNESTETHYSSVTRASRIERTQ